jgi:hypothetical protein
MANSAKKLMGKAGFSFLALLILVLGTLNPEPAYAGWKTKAALTAGTILAGQAIKKCIQPSGCPKMLMDKLGDHLVKHPEHRQKLLEIVQTRATTQFKDRILKSPSARESYEKLVHFIRGSGTRKSGVPDQNFKPNPSVKDSYQRPTAAGPTKAQKEYVQGKPCVDCGRVTPTQVADHKKTSGCGTLRARSDRCRQAGNKRGGAAALPNLFQPARWPIRSIWKTHEKIASR